MKNKITIYIAFLLSISLLSVLSGCGNDISDVNLLQDISPSPEPGYLKINSDISYGYGVLILYNLTSSSAVPYEQKHCNSEGDTIFSNIPVKKLCRVEIFSCQSSYYNDPDNPVAAKNINFTSSGLEVSLAAGSIESSPDEAPIPPVITPTPGNPT